MLEPLQWAAKETFRQYGVSLTSVAEPDRPASLAIWLTAYRGLVGLVLFLVTWLFMVLFGAWPYLGALLSVIAVYGGLWLAGIRTSAGESALARLLVPAYGDPLYDAHRSEAVYLLLLAVKPVTLFALCLHWQFIWLLPLTLLGGCIVHDLTVMTPVSLQKDAAAKPTLGGYAHWLIALAVSLIATILWGRFYGGPAAFAIAALVSVVAFSLTQLVIPRIRGLKFGPVIVRKMVQCAADTVLFLLALLTLLF